MVERFSHRWLKGHSPTRRRVDLTLQMSPKRRRVFRGESTRLRVGLVNRDGAVMKLRRRTGVLKICPSCVRTLALSKDFWEVFSR